MLETPHVMVGAAIAVKVGNPLLAIPLAFASHFVLEKVPHWNPHVNTELKKYGKVSRRSTIIATVDASLALLMGSYVALSFLPDTFMTLTVLAACFASVLPDLIEAPYFFLNFRSKAIARWVVFKKSLQADATPFWGLVTQIIAVVSSIWWLRS